MAKPSRQSHGIEFELTLFLWNVSVDTNESVAKPQLEAATINQLHAPVTAFMLNCFDTYALPRRDEGSGKFCAVISDNWKWLLELECIAII